MKYIVLLLPISAYVDASWGNDYSDRKSTTGGIIKLYGNPVLWISKKQRTVALSSCEAEYLALSSSIQELLWVRSLYNEIFNTNSNNIKVYDDSQSAIALAKNDVHHPRTKHIDIRHHFIRDHINKNIIDIVYISTEEQVADILTKPIRTPSFQKHISTLLEGV